MGVVWEKPRDCSSASSWANVSTPVVENLVLTGGFDALYGIDLDVGARPRGQITRRDLLLEVADLERLSRSERARGRGGRPSRAALRADPRAARASVAWGRERAAEAEGLPVPRGRSAGIGAPPVGGVPIGRGVGGPPLPGSAAPSRGAGGPPLPGNAADPDDNFGER